MRRYTCCFTGHRNLPVDRLNEIEERTIREVRELITKHSVRFFGVGGAIGYDTLATKALFRLREKEFPHIKIILVYPFETFTDRWTAAQKTEYALLFPKFDKHVCVCDAPSTDAYLARNRHLIDNSTFCITYCVQDHGGTYYTMRYAIQHGIQVRNVAHVQNPTL